MYVQDLHCDGGTLTGLPPVPFDGGSVSWNESEVKPHIYMERGTQNT